MQFTLSKTFLYWSSVVVLGIAIGLSIQFVQAWTAPVGIPPASTISGPLTVGNVAQTKAGSLAINSSGSFLNALLIPFGNVGIGTNNPGQRLDVNGYVRGGTGLCIGNDCRTTWPVTGGGITSLSAGSGVTLSPNPITTTGTISADFSTSQRRVSATCAVGSSIRTINADGTVSCEVDDAGGSITGGNCPSGQVMTGISTTGVVQCAAGGVAYSIEQHGGNPLYYSVYDGFLYPRCGCDTSVENGSSGNTVTSCGANVFSNGHGEQAYDLTGGFYSSDIGSTCYDHLQVVLGNASVKYIRI